MPIQSQHRTLKRALAIIDDWSFSSLGEQFYHPTPEEVRPELGQPKCFVSELRKQVFREGLPHLKELGVLREAITRNLCLTEDRLTCLLAIYSRICGFLVIAASALWTSFTTEDSFFQTHQPYFYLAGLLFVAGMIWIQSLIPKNAFFSASAQPLAWSQEFIRLTTELFRVQEKEFYEDWNSAKNTRRHRSTPEHGLLFINRKLERRVLQLKSQIFIWEWLGLGVPTALLLAPWVLRMLETGSP